MFSSKNFIFTIFFLQGLIELTFYSVLSRDVINFSLDIEGDAYYEIKTVYGALVKTAAIESNEINISDLFPGIYFLYILESKSSKKLHYVTFNKI